MKKIGTWTAGIFVGISVVAFNDWFWHSALTEGMDLAFIALLGLVGLSCLGALLLWKRNKKHDDSLVLVLSGIMASMCVGMYFARARLSQLPATDKVIDGIFLSLLGGLPTLYAFFGQPKEESKVKG